MDSQQISEFYNQVNNYVLQHFVLFWSIILGVFAIIGVALYFIVNSIVNARVKKSLEESSRQINELEKTTLSIEKMLNQLNIAIDNIQAQTHARNYDLPLCDGYCSLPGYKSQYTRFDNGLVVIHVFVRPDKGDFQSGERVFAMLPVGFRPIEPFILQLASGVNIMVDVKGEISYQINQSGVNSLAFTAAFNASQIH